MAYASSQPQPADGQPQQQRKKPTEPAPTASPPPQNAPPILASQQQAGLMITNVMRAEQNAPSPPAPQFPLQPKLTIGQPNDKYEQEVDCLGQSAERNRTARQVVQQIHAPSHEIQQPKFQIRHSLEAPLQPVQAADAATGGTASADFEQQLNQARGGGQPLKPQVAQQMGSAMNADFSSVKVHTDSTSDQLNRSIQARAFTTGPDIFFKRGEYNPSTKGGQELIAHELTHTVQQGAAAQCQPDISAKYAGNGQPLQPKRFEAPAISTQPGQNRAVRLKAAVRRPLGRLPAVQLQEVLPTRFQGIQRDSLPAAPTPTTEPGSQRNRAGAVPDVAPPDSTTTDDSTPAEIADFSVEERVEATEDKLPGLNRVLSYLQDIFGRTVAKSLVSVERIVIHVTNDDFKIQFWPKESADLSVFTHEVAAFYDNCLYKVPRICRKRHGVSWIERITLGRDDNYNCLKAQLVLKEVSERSEETIRHGNAREGFAGTMGVVIGSDADTMAADAVAGAASGQTVSAATGNTIVGETMRMGQYFQESKVGQAETYQSVNQQITDWSPDSFLGVLGVAAALAAPIFKAFMAFRRYEQFSLQNRKIQGLEQSLDQAQSVPEPNATLTESLDYALSKANRLWWRYFGDFVICCCQALNRILALLCPVIALGSAIVDVALSVARFAAMFVEKGKGLVKWWRGTRGQQRWESGRTIYEAALAEDPAALDAIRALTLNDSTFLTKSFLTNVLKGNHIFNATPTMRKQNNKGMKRLVRQAVDANEGLYGDSSELFKARMEVGIMEWANGTPPRSNDILVAILKVFNNNDVWRQRCSQYLAEEMKSSL
ncbi:MAG: DUF4157 domain-containing protein [Spirulina sp. SIO3F2]|nr:DUF4157 domain-containing protein [Spirulina sp. SIO3F2]